MRICLFTPTYLPSFGGAEVAGDLIVRSLIERGHDVRVLAARVRGKSVDLPYEVHRYRRPWRQNWWPELLAWPLRRVHRRWPFEVCLAFYGYPTGYAAAWLKKRMKPRQRFGLIVTPRGSDLYRRFRDEHRWRVQACRRAGYQGADRIVSISSWMTTRLHELVGEPLPPIDLVYNGVDLAAFDRLRDESRTSPPTLPIAQPFALHLGRLAPVKRVDLAVQAVGRLADAFRQRGLSYAIVGDGKEREKLAALIESLGVGDIVRLLGRRTGVEKAWLYDNAAFLVSASQEEGMPTVVLEAMAGGLPILASDIDPHRELIEQRGWGRLFLRDDLDDLVRGLRLMIESDNQPLRQSALEHREDFSLTRMIDGYEAACRAVMPVG